MMRLKLIRKTSTWFCDIIFNLSFEERLKKDPKQLKHCLNVFNLKFLIGV